KVVHKKCEEYKVAIRNSRRDANEMLKGLKKDGDIAEDDAFKAQKEVQQITDEYIKLIGDDLYTEKEKEILEF
ncbi:ribosome recycling factor, partial [bacterium]|nr:ribosome recycling factor [bacterium]